MTLRQELEAAGALNADRNDEAAQHFTSAVPAPTRRTIPIDFLVPMSGNPRNTVGDVNGLLQSIRTNGFIGALSVRPFGAQFEVWAGNRRLEAAKQAGLTELPCEVYDLTDVQALELNLTEQINRADLTPMEEGQACRRLVELAGYSVDQVAQKLGQSRSWVSTRMALCGLAPEVVTALEGGALKLSVAQALAALPSQMLQVKALDTLRAVESQPVATQLEHLRTTLCRALKGATWKLTDEMLVTEAGACSVCPHNSANDGMPGLFDAKSKAPMCANPSCFDDKLRAAWAKRTAKAAEQGAKVLTLAESARLFPRGGTTLPYSTRYVDGDTVVHEDKDKRTWLQLVEEIPAEHRPVVHLAQDGEGKARDLFVQSKAVEAIAKHLRLRWAKKRLEADTEEEEATETDKKPLGDVGIREARREVVDEVRKAVALKLLAKPTLEQARFLADAFEARAEDFAAQVVGRKVGKKWFEKEASMSDLLALAWWCGTGESWGVWAGFEEDFLECAKAHGFDVEKMMAAKLGGKS